MSSDGLQDVATRAVSFAYSASSTWQGGVCMLFTYRLRGGEQETGPPRTTLTTWYDI
jgi:hypothetical protein